MNGQWKRIQMMGFIKTTIEFFEEAVWAAMVGGCPISYRFMSLPRLDDADMGFRIALYISL